MSETQEAQREILLMDRDVWWQRDYGLAEKPTARAKALTTATKLREYQTLERIGKRWIW